MKIQVADVKALVVNWPQVIRFLMEDEDFGVQIKKEIPRTADLDAQLKNINDPYMRMKIIYQYVKRIWNGMVTLVFGHWME